MTSLPQELSIPDPGIQPEPAAGLRVVGLGGSAGSIAALRTFFRTLRADSGMAFVVIIHLSPEHESLLSGLLQQSTAMRVVQAQDQEPILANTVYVIPPRKMLESVDGHLRVTDLPAERGRHVVVDHFFRTLAESRGPNAAAIVLSGIDGDGAIGVKRVKEYGGLTIAQDPDEAEYNGMPRSAIDTGMIDWVLPVKEMPARLLQYQRVGQQLQLPPSEVPKQPALVPAAADEAEGALRDVLSFLRGRTGHDFSYYKRATILRRIGRRMMVNGIERLPDYLSCMRMRQGESAVLLQELLISVTNFFRDSNCFHALELRIADVFKNKTPQDTVRAWVAACATGEEAYSVAMLMAEHALGMDEPPLIQVFATDLDEQAIRVARDGLYPGHIEMDVSRERLRRFFVKEGTGYRVRREVRESVLFAGHDLLRDAPFSRVDLVSCRNLLIYLNHDAQARALQVFHFALRPHGLLLLGSSESAEEGGALFSVLDKKHRLYEQQPMPGRTPSVPLAPANLINTLDVRASGPPPVSTGRAFQMSIDGNPWPHAKPVTGRWGEIHLRLLEHLAPPSILLDGQHDIVHLSPKAARYLQYSGGEPTRNLLLTVHPGLRAELRAALYQASQSGLPIEVPQVAIDLDDAVLVVRIRVTPAPDVAPGMLLVTLAQLALPAVADGLLLPEPRMADPAAHQLDLELKDLKSHLRETIRQYETSTEELRASNEELQAMNEELRSATEELETSREEMHSINEELSTVNRELKNNVEELDHANSDLHNLMDATAVATIFLDRDLRITRFTPSAVTLFNLIASDVGRPLADLRSNLAYPELAQDASHVLHRLVQIEREVSEGSGSWYLARLRAYRTLEDRIAGVVVILVNITERKMALEALRRSDERLRLVIENAREYAIFAIDLERHVTFWNSGAQHLLGYSEAEILGHSGDVIFTPDDRVAGAPEQEAQGALRDGRASDDRFHVRKDGSRFWASGATMTMRDGSGQVVGLVKILRDQSTAREAEQSLKQSRQEVLDALLQTEQARSDLAAANEAKDRFLAVLSHELRTPLTPVLTAVHVLSRRTDVDAPMRKMLDMIHRNVRIEAHLIDDLLDLTHISRGTMSITREPVDMHDAVRGALEICEADIHSRQQALAVQLDASECILPGDMDRLQQVIWNLLQNASKFTPSGGVITLRTHSANGRFVLSITDNGMGIESAALQTIFEAFNQGRTDVASTYGGMGLGLAIAKATIVAHGGTLTAASAGAGQGATFLAELPLV